MFLAVVIACSSLSIDSCTMMANTDNIWMTEEECAEDAVAMSNLLASQGVYARWACFKVGEGV
jgi:hypothetical protein